MSIDRSVGSEFDGPSRGLPSGFASPCVAVIGAGPAGLMAAEVLLAAGARVEVFDGMPSAGRKFLLAGRGGLNLTHSEAWAPFMARYAERRAALTPHIEVFTAQALRDWAQALGVSTFVGSSGRVFPTDMKAAPLLRAWLHRLRGMGRQAGAQHDGGDGLLRMHMRHRWVGWTDAGVLRFAAPSGEVLFKPDATVLALGGGSWARLGSDGAWLPTLGARGVDVAALKPANCGFDVAPTGAGRSAWSAHLIERFAGQPVKPVALRYTDGHGVTQYQQGEFVVTRTGVEGSLIYAFAAPLREAIAAHGSATIYLDLLPAHTSEQVLAEVSRPRGPRSLSTHLKSRLNLQGLKAALLHEVLSPEQLSDPRTLAPLLKALPIVLAAPRPIDEAISTAGGVRFEALDERLMLKALPGVFCAGEMLDWEAPTGGYLLTASMATGRAAGAGAMAWWRRQQQQRS